MDREEAGGRRMSGGEEREREEREAPLQGDILEEIISHVPSIDLVPASHVSKSWSRAVSSYLRRSPRRRIPWLVIHLHSRRHPTTTPVLTHAYDPLARRWIQIPQPPAGGLGHGLRSSHSGLLHALSPSELALSTDAFGSTWRRLCAPRVWRDDAVVALVGSRVVVAGGVYDFEPEGDPCAVEIFAAKGGGDAGQWVACEPMPDAFRDSASAMWLSVAASDRELFVLEKRAGRLCSFEPETKRWGRTRQLCTDPAVFLSAIGLAGDRLILVEASGVATDVESVRLWEVDSDTLARKEVGRMPAEMVGRLVGDGWGLSSSIGFSAAGGFGYLYNPSDLREIFLCEFWEGACCTWTSFGLPAAVDRNPMHAAVFGCSPVGMDDLKRFLRPAAA